MIDILKVAILDILGSRPGIRHHESLADALEQLAGEQRELAAAKRRQDRKPADQRIVPRSPKAGPGRAPSRWIRVDRTQGRLMLYVGRGIFYDWQSPARMSVERRGGHVVLVADAHGQYAIIAPRNHMPHMVVDGARDLIDLEDGRYEADVRGSIVIIGDAL